jgi:hypothetical protein
MAEESKPKASPPVDPEVWSIVAEELAALPDTQRLILQQFLFEGQSYERLAESFKIPIATVASHIRRGRQVLRTRLAARGLAVAGVVTTASLAAATLPSEVCAATIQSATAIVTGQLNLLPVHIVSLMKGAMTNMVTTAKLLVLIVAGLAAATPASLWFARQAAVEPAEVQFAVTAQPTLVPSLVLNVDLPPEADDHAPGAAPSVSVSFSNN